MLWSGVHFKLQSEVLFDLAHWGHRSCIQRKLMNVIILVGNSGLNAAINACERYFAHVHCTRGCYADQWQNATFCTHFNHFENGKFHFNNSIESIFWVRLNPLFDAIEWVFEWKTFDLRTQSNWTGFRCQCQCQRRLVCLNYMRKYLNGMNFVSAISISHEISTEWDSLWLLLQKYWHE